MPHAARNLTDADSGASAKQESLSQLIVFGEASLRRALDE
jgi:hypothetical protein